MSASTLILDKPEKVTLACGILQRLSMEKPWKVTVELFKPNRSDSQNRRLWKLHTLASEFTGYTPEEMHEEALCKHFGFTEVEVKDFFTGEIAMKRRPLKRSSARNTKEFAAFMEQTEIWYITEFGVFLGQE